MGNVASKNLLRIVEDVSCYVWLKPMAACTAVVTTEIVLSWSTAKGGTASAGERYGTTIFQESSAAVSGSCAEYVASLCGRECAIDQWYGGARDAKDSAHFQDDYE